MKLLITVCILTILLTGSSVINKNQNLQDSIPVRSDTLYKKNYLSPAFQAITFDILLNRYNYHVAGLEWANVNLTSWKRNIKTGFKTDGDAFGTNWFSHPSHGSFAFNSARINNLGFYRSMPYVFSSSMIWEYFAETEPPSIIDLYTTTFGGIFLGEVTYRLSDIAWNYPYPQKNHLMRQILGSIINPMAAFNRWTLGKRIPQTDQTFTQLRTSFNSGFFTRIHSSNSNFSDNGFSLGLGVLYGNPYEEVKKPFDRFSLHIWLLQMNHRNFSVPFFNFSSEAVMFGSNKPIGSNSVLYYSLNHDYNFLNNDLYKFSSLALSGSASFSKNTDRFQLNLGSKLGIILLGSSGSDFVQPVHPEWFQGFKRDYLYGHGFLIGSSGNLNFGKAGYLDFNYKKYNIYSNENPKGLKSINILSLQYDVPLYSRINLRAGYNRYFSNSDFLTTSEKLNETDVFDEILVSFVLHF